MLELYLRRAVAAAVYSQPGGGLCRHGAVRVFAVIQFRVNHWC